MRTEAAPSQSQRIESFDFDGLEQLGVEQIAEVARFAWQENERQDPPPRPDVLKALYERALVLFEQETRRQPAGRDGHLWHTWMTYTLIREHHEKADQAATGIDITP